MTKNKTQAEYAVVLTRANKPDRYLSGNGMAWELDPAKADLMNREQAERVAKSHGSGVSIERM